MAEALFRVRVADEISDWAIGSAGTWARDGQLAARHVHAVMDARGIDMRAHRSRAVSREILTAFRLVLVMEHGHKEALQIEFPEVRGRIYLLSEMAGRLLDIADPIGGPLVDFEDTANELEQYLTVGLDRIRALARIKANKIG
ncbi:MAG: hypothetical protein HN413_16000 [Chloroflexi bacterium]|nr:hypothetical protein [Chloroflexota bacterium]